MATVYLLRYRRGCSAPALSLLVDAKQLTQALDAAAELVPADATHLEMERLEIQSWRVESDAMSDQETERND